MPKETANRAMTIVRVTTAALVGIHGFYRGLAGGVEPFGRYLDAEGVPAGLAVAWAITLFEMAGSLLLVAGRVVVPVASLQIVILAAGIAMVHAPAGWFVVGGGRNGVEYSVLLVACLVATIVERLRAREDGGAA